ncbi:hypothetical protein KHQ81_06865 [Mycoplasmatota bacterium]|nr:hypothetical protein KHQ81_06865 [Mycoplasmatota bacterium]
MTIIKKQLYSEKTLWYQWINHVSDLAKNEGFDTLIIKGERALNSSSANPGHVIDYIINLR